MKASETAEYYRDMLVRIQADRSYQDNLKWGDPRPGHPEGTIGAHIVELVPCAPGEAGMMRLTPMPPPPTPPLVLLALRSFGWAGFMLVMLWLLSLRPIVAGLDMSATGHIFLFAFHALFLLGWTATLTHYLNLFPNDENKLP